MLLVSGRSRADGIDALYVEDWLLHPQLRVFSIELTGGVLDESVLGQACRRPPDLLGTRNGAIYVESGELVVTLGGRTRVLCPGELALWPIGPRDMRFVPPTRGSFRALGLDWTIPPGTPTNLQLAELTPARASMTHLRWSIRNKNRRDSEAALADVVGRLESEGIPIHLRPSPVETPAVQSVVETLAETIMARPGIARGMKDLVEQSGLSPRHISRILAYIERHYLVGAGCLRDQTRKNRAHLGSIFQTAKGATTERVAKFLGYSDPSSYCRALDELGLPSPANLARVVRAGYR